MHVCTHMRVHAFIIIRMCTHTYTSMYTFIIIHIHPFIDPSIHPCIHNTYTHLYHSWKERVHALLLWRSRSFTTGTDRGSLPVSLSSFEHRLTICVKSSMMKESLRCDRSGDLQDPLLFSVFCCRITQLAWSNGFQRLETRFTCCRSAPGSAVWASYFKGDHVITCTPMCWPLSHYPTQVMSHESHRQPANNHLR